MKIIHLLIIALLISCSQKQPQQGAIEILEEETEVVITADLAEAAVKTIDQDQDFHEVINNLQMRTLPWIEHSNFDQFIDEADVKGINHQALKMTEVYPDFEPEGSRYEAMTSYRLDLSSNYFTVIVVYKLENYEMLSTLINYDMEGNVIDHVLVAYDEISTGMTQSASRISEDKITYHDIYWTEKKEIRQTDYKINYDGKIEKGDSQVLSEVFQNYTLILSALDELNLDMLQVKSDLMVYSAKPENMDQYILVIPEIVEEATEYFTLNSHVVIVDEISGKILQRFSESHEYNGWVSDAIGLTSIDIDTAPYMVTPGHRAFGVRVSFHGMSRVNPYDKESISLFVNFGDHLKRLLNAYTAVESRGEWDGSCEGVFTASKKVFIMSENQTDGLFDITVKNKINVSKSIEDENGECNAEDTNFTETSVLKYNGQEYIEHQ
ncbi:hypothetical protein [Marinoscillum pacificum]|uniref:hypothetical protein n=1 Tax=Marinoscillum pacificum TaxID=392723 RepID=UPI0021571801|nr:hypothetical protein [Marinoscillum pacificum]